MPNYTWNDWDNRNNFTPTQGGNGEDLSQRRAFYDALANTPLTLPFAPEPRPTQDMQRVDMPNPFADKRQKDEFEDSPRPKQIETPITNAAQPLKDAFPNMNRGFANLLGAGAATVQGIGKALGGAWGETKGDEVGAVPFGNVARSLPGGIGLGQIGAEALFPQYREASKTPLRDVPVLGQVTRAGEALGGAGNAGYETVSKPAIGAFAALRESNEAARAKMDVPILTPIANAVKGISDPIQSLITGGRNEQFFNAANTNPEEARALLGGWINGTNTPEQDKQFEDITRKGYTSEEEVNPVSTIILGSVFDPLTYVDAAAIIPKIGAIKNLRRAWEAGGDVMRAGEAIGDASPLEKLLYKAFQPKNLAKGELLADEAKKANVIGRVLKPFEDTPTTKVIKTIERVLGNMQPYLTDASRSFADKVKMLDLMGQAAKDGKLTDNLLQFMGEQGIKNAPDYHRSVRAALNYSPKQIVEEYKRAQEILASLRQTTQTQRAAKFSEDIAGFVGAEDKGLSKGYQNIFDRVIENWKAGKLDLDEAARELENMAGVRLSNDLTQHMANALPKQHGVKTPNFITKLVETMKAYEGLLYIGANPASMVQNFAGDISRMAQFGVNPAEFGRGYAELTKRIGYRPPENIGGLVREAVTGVKGDDVSAFGANLPDWIKKTPILKQMNAAFQKSQTMGRELAWATGFERFMARNFTPPAFTPAMQSHFGGDAARMLERLKEARNYKEAEDILFRGMPTFGEYKEQVAQALTEQFSRIAGRPFEITPDMLTEALDPARKERVRRILGEAWERVQKGDEAGNAFRQARARITAQDVAKDDFIDLWGDAPTTPKQPEPSTLPPTKPIGKQAPTPKQVEGQPQGGVFRDEPPDVPSAPMPEPNPPDMPPSAPSAGLSLTPLDENPLPPQDLPSVKLTTGQVKARDYLLGLKRADGAPIYTPAQLETWRPDTLERIAGELQTAPKQLRDVMQLAIQKGYANVRADETISDALLYSLNRMAGDAPPFTWDNLRTRTDEAYRMLNEAEDIIGNEFPNRVPRNVPARGIDIPNLSDAELQNIIDDPYRFAPDKQRARDELARRKPTPEAKQAVASAPTNAPAQVADVAPTAPRTDFSGNWFVEDDGTGKRIDFKNEKAMRKWLETKTGNAPAQAAEQVAESGAKAFGETGNVLFRRDIRNGNITYTAIRGENNEIVAIRRINSNSLSGQESRYTLKDINQSIRSGNEFVAEYMGREKKNVGGKADLWRQMWENQKQENDALEEIQSLMLKDATDKISSPRNAADAQLRGGDQQHNAQQGFTQRFNAATDTPEFKRWFGDSKIVDAEGKPLVVYHGTANPQFKKFSYDKVGKATDEGWYGQAFYFTDSPQSAESYAMQSNFGTRPTVLPVFVKVENPLIFKYADNGKLPSELIKTLQERIPYDDFGDVIDYSTMTRYEMFDMLREQGEDAASLLKELGYDGVIVETSRRGFPREIVAFEPTQIKSAIGNRGTFDPNNPNILNATDNTLRGIDPYAQSTIAPEERLRRIINAAQQEGASAVTNGRINEAGSEAMTDMMLDAIEKAFAEQAQRAANVMPPDVVNEIRQYLKQAFMPELNAAKQMGNAVGRQFVDATVLNYDHRWNIDEGMGLAAPFTYWWLHTLANYTQNFIDHPAYLAFLMHLRERIDKESEGMPDRFKHKIEIAIPGSPDTLWTNPMRTLAPFPDVFQLDNIERAGYTAVGEDGTPDYGNVFQDLFGIHTPYKLAHALLTGKDADVKNIIASIPAARLLRSTTGIGIEGKYDQAYYERAMKELVADGTLTEEQAKVALLQQKGRDWETIKQRAGLENYTVPNLTALTGFRGTPFTAGERKYYETRRARDTMLDAAVRRMGGNPNMSDEARYEFLNKRDYFKSDEWQQFKEQNPELDAASFANKAYGDNGQRLPQQETQDARARDYYVSAIWDAYRAAPELKQKLIAADLGDEFKQTFLGAKGDYSKIPMRTLLGWANALDTMLQEPVAGGTNPIPDPFKVTFTTDDQNKRYQDFYDGIEQSFGWANVHDLERQYFAIDDKAQRAAFLKQNPMLKLAWDNESKFYADNNDLLRIMERAGLKQPKTNAPQEATKGSALAQAVEATGLNWDTINAKKAEYNKLPKGTGARTAYLKANPDLLRYFQLAGAIYNEDTELQTQGGGSGSSTYTRHIYVPRAYQGGHYAGKQPQRIYLNIRSFGNSQGQTQQGAGQGQNNYTPRRISAGGY